MSRLLIDTLLRYREQGKFLLHEFVLMPDHFHLIITPAADVSLEKALQLIKGGFSFRVKQEMHSNLEIWQPGFTEHRVKDCKDFERHCTYIRENPVRARLVEGAAKCPYSAVKAFRVDAEPPWLKPQLEDSALSLA